MLQRSPLSPKARPAPSRARRAELRTRVPEGGYALGSIERVIEFNTLALAARSRRDAARARSPEHRETLIGNARSALERSRYWRVTRARIGLRHLLA